MTTSSINNQLKNRPDFDQSHKPDHIYEKVLIVAIPWFLKSITSQDFNSELNEKRYTQEFVICLNRTLKDLEYPLVVQIEYHDVHTEGADTNRAVDFAFIFDEQGASTKSLYSVEAKRLPTGGNREREYVWGYFKSGSPCGGIQRFKTGDHGQGLPGCGLLGYVENEDFGHWFAAINNWITDKVKESPAEWNENELLKNLQVHPDGRYSTSHSIGERESGIVKLFHLWIKIPCEQKQKP
jgi:hypothetical protein